MAQPLLVTPSCPVHEPTTRPWRAAEGWMSSCQTRLEQVFAREAGPLDFALRYHFARAGKRSRARLALAAGCSLGLRQATAVDLAVACELLHEASLVHDDVQDRDTTRRGQPALWALLGEDLAINVGDYLIASAIDVAASTRAPEHRRGRLVSVFTRHTLEAVRGQVRDNTAAGDPSFDVEAYEALARAKTGALLTLPVEGALVLAGADPRLHDIARQAMGWLGVAYQSQDDLSELFGLDPDHETAADVETGRPNAALAHFLESVSVAERARFHEARSREEIERWIGEARRSGAATSALARARAHYARARGLFAELPPALGEVLRLCADRMSRPLDEIERVHAAAAR